MISCVMAAHNAARTIQAAIESVWQQTVQDLELIVVDDGSTDETHSLLARIGDRRLRVVRQPRSGPSVARNRALSLARGEFVAVIDADDIWLPRKLEVQLAALVRHPDAAVAYGWTDFVDEQLRPTYPDGRATDEGDVLASLLRQNFICCGSNTLMRRAAVESVGGFDETLPAVEDWDLHVRLASRYSFAVARESVVQYRRSPCSLSSHVDLMEACFLAAAHKIFAGVPHHLRPLQRPAKGAFYRYIAVRTTQSGTVTAKWRRLPRLLALAVWHDPAGLWRDARRRGAALISSPRRPL